MVKKLDNNSPSILPGLSNNQPYSQRSYAASRDFDSKKVKKVCDINLTYEGFGGLIVNKEWSELNKAMQTQIRKNDTYGAGIDTLFELRNRLMKILTVFYSELNREEFNAILF